MDGQNIIQPITTSESKESGRLKVDTTGIQKKKKQILKRKLRNL